MLSKEAEKFLLNLRLELMSRGKKDKDIQEIEEELRDHLKEAEHMDKVSKALPEALSKIISVPFPKNCRGIKAL
ncbi:hypothetical protein [Oceanobacillus oncorhynchi]|uniref:hypothetical protein n=1 Tax=Oceanobacillus oncorhynchi TaxID=545501 RepID=UPI0034D69698